MDISKDDASLVAGVLVPTIEQAQLMVTRLEQAMKNPGAGEAEQKLMDHWKARRDGLQGVFLRLVEQGLYREG